MTRTACAVLLALGALTVAACCPAPRPDKLPDNAYPGTLRAPSDLGTQVMLRQKVTAKWGKSQARSFEAVLQVQGDTMTVLGLSPMGQMGFAITLKDGKIDFQNRSGMDLPFPPRFILLDVQRAFWPWLGPAPTADGERAGEAPGEKVTETWADGRLRRRTFRRSNNEPPGAIVVTYEGWKDSAQAPDKVILDNRWFGYVLTVETYEQQRLSLR